MPKPSDAAKTVAEIQAQRITDLEHEVENQKRGAEWERDEKIRAKVAIMRLLRARDELRDAWAEARGVCGG